jgi:hypothetical protein
MRVIFLLAIAIVSAVPTCNRARILACAMTWLDTDHDNRINATELNNYVLNQPCGPDPTRFTGAGILLACDKNMDGYLDATDYDVIGSCMEIHTYQMLACNKCNDCEKYTR